MELQIDPIRQLCSRVVLFSLREIKRVKLFPHDVIQGELVEPTIGPTFGAVGGGRGAGAIEFELLYLLGSIFFDLRSGMDLRD